MLLFPGRLYGRILADPDRHLQAPWDDAPLFEGEPQDQAVPATRPLADGSAGENNFLHGGFENRMTLAAAGAVHHPGEAIDDGIPAMDLESTGRL
jgi:hypothetical protein